MTIYNKNKDNGLVRISGDGRVTLPKEVLSKFELKADDFVLVSSNGDHIDIVPVAITRKFQDATALSKMEAMEESA